MASLRPSEGAPRRRARRVLTSFLLSLVLAGCGLPRWPVEGPLTSAFGVRWRGTLPEVHRGVDIGVPDGTPVRAMARGRVVYAGSMGGYGKVVFLDHGRGVVTVYAHLGELRAVTGDAVGGGDVIALSGSSGSAAGAHLHFEVRLNGRAWNPVPLLGGRP